MSDTPRTYEKAVSHIGFYSCATTPADFSRQLESELNEANRKIQALRHEKNACIAGNKYYADKVGILQERLWKAIEIVEATWELEGYADKELKAELEAIKSEIQ